MTANGFCALFSFGTTFLSFGAISGIMITEPGLSMFVSPPVVMLPASVATALRVNARALGSGAKFHSNPQNFSLDDGVRLRTWGNLGCNTF